MYSGWAPAPSMLTGKQRDEYTKIRGREREHKFTYVGFMELAYVGVDLKENKETDTCRALIMVSRAPKVSPIKPLIIVYRRLPEVPKRHAK